MAKKNPFVPYTAADDKKQDAKSASKPKGKPKGK